MSIVKVRFIVYTFEILQKYTRERKDGEEQISREVPQMMGACCRYSLY